MEQDRLQDLSEVFATIGEVWSKSQSAKERRKVDPAELHSRLVSTSTAFARNPDAKSARSFLTEIDNALAVDTGDALATTPTVTVTVTITITITIRQSNPPVA